MPINFLDGGNANFTKPPRSIYTADSVSGCPPGRAAGTRIAETTFITAGPAAIVLDGNTIRTNSQGGRCDLHLYVNGTRVDQTLDYNDGQTSNWQDAVVGYMGTVSAGTHTVWYQSTNCAGWGCGSDWGHLQVLIFE
jgi:hypothetical protein